MISLIFPAFNEQDNLELLHDNVNAVISKIMGHTFEIIFVDDCSTDKTPELLQRLHKKDDRIKIIRFARNCGTHAALTAGLNHSLGDCAIAMSADLQDPPELITQLLEKWESGAKIVWGVRSEDERSKVKFFSKLYYSSINRLTSVKMPPLGADVFLIDRIAINAFKQISEHHTSIFMTLAWLGFTQKNVEYSKEIRHKGKSKWTLSKKVKLLIDSILSFSYTPIRFMSAIGIITALFGFLYAALVVFKYIFLGVPVAGWSSLIIVILVIGGVQMIMLGVLGEYLWRTFDESKKRPSYIIEYSIESKMHSVPASSRPNLKHL